MRIRYLGVLLLWLPHCLLESVPSSPTCFPERQRENIRSFNFNGSATPITIGSSDRITHNVTSNVYYILLKEILDYTDVEIVTEPEITLEPLAAIIKLRSRTNPDRTARVPKIVINLEIWTRIDFEIPVNNQVINLGHIAPPGKFGWFARNGRKDTCWQTFQERSGIQEYALDSKDREHIQSYCVNHPCQPIIRPDRCGSVKCATLLIETSDPYIRNTSQHIKEMGLLVELWPVSELSVLVAELPLSSKLLVVAWEPAPVIATGDWIPVTFPSCDTDEDTPGCMYELRRLNKFCSFSMEKGAREAYQAARKMIFSRQDVDDMLMDSRNMSHFDVACKWMKAHRRTWDMWTTSARQAPLQICGIFPLDPIATARYSATNLPSIAQFAISRINNKSITNILPTRDLHLSRANGACNSEMPMNTFIDFILGNDAKELVGVLGPGCSDSLESLIYLTTHFRTAVISYSAEGSISSLSERKKYPYFFRTIGENLDFKQVYLDLCLEMGWKRIGALTEDSLKYTEYLKYLEKPLRDEGITWENFKFLKDHVNASIITYMKDLEARRTRIIIADVHDAAARSVMCEAYHKKMTQKHGYVWFLPRWLSSNWYDIDGLKNVSKEDVPCTTAQMEEAIQGYLSIAHRNLADNDTMTHENITVKEWREECRKFLQRDTGLPLDMIELPVFAGYAYDAVWTYALALDKLQRHDPLLLANIHSMEATEKYIQLIQNTSFIGVSGPVTFPGSKPSRTSPICIWQWANGEYTLVGLFDNTTFKLRNKTDKALTMYRKKLKWYTEDGSTPHDGGEASLCGVQGLADALGTNCAGAIVIVNVAVIILISGVIFAAVYFYKRKYDKRIGQLEKTEKFMKQFGFDLIPANISDLDKWEVPRDSVVINRKLGAGAFGTVYGGEAKIDEDGWVAAAVKTLKPTANTEEKLDFLGEAELMKRFEHKNIVKLLGVCTRTEPVYTIMEFMLYGDLKTFLQNRRHLVTGRHTADESNEVSNKKLTSYALDIARGLSYLASQKYVHRDLACRNCLLNSNKTAKIGDFGMTRRLYESDYYKFSRKGMMPIRWMAPESIADGLFTSKSDVWAFGVVLFEIVTFGSYPFPGLSNNEVLEYVKVGNSHTVPKGAKSQLEGLMKSCWNIDKDKRPDPSDLVVFLASNPRALSPCIDSVPTSAGLQPELLDRHLSAPASPFDPISGFFGEEDIVAEGSPPDTPPRNSSPVAFQDENASLLPHGHQVQIQMTQRAPLASRNTSDLDITSDVL